MSGFAAVVNFDGAPVEPQLLGCLAGALRFRAPDGERTQQLDGVGFAYADMRIEGDPPRGRQPLCLDDRWWIVAHARLYERKELVSALCSAGADAHADQPDAWLLLLAYHAWGLQCLGRLHGDFSFALWDSRERKLVCASDPFGARPLFYSCHGHRIQVSNTLSALRDVFGHRHDLNDSFVADFLCFEFSVSPEATAYRQIRRLPPAHLLTVRAGEAPEIRRYWALPTPALDLKRSATDTREQFRHLLGRAVLERLPDGPASLALSGGLDSTAIAAIAARAGVTGLRTLTRGSKTLTADPEPRLAAAVASALDLPHQLLDSDPDVPFDDWERRMPFMPEPLNEPYWRAKHAGRETLAAHGRVVMVGEGGDELLAPEFACDLLGRVPVTRLIHDAGRYWRRYHRRPPIGLRRAIQRWRGRRPDYGSWARPPQWINPDLVREWHLDDRVTAFYRDVDTIADHPTRPNGVTQLNAATSLTRGGNDPGTMGLPLEWRKPFLDRRLVEFLYSIPPLYWCSRKTILREAMIGSLPLEILERRKMANEVGDRTQSTSAPWWDDFRPAAQLARYIDLGELAVLRNARKPLANTPEMTRRDLLPVCLNYWLKALN